MKHLLLCSIHEIPIAIDTRAIARMEAGDQEHMGKTLLNPARLLRIPKPDMMSTDRKLLILKDHPDTAIEINEPKEIVMIEDKEIHHLPELIRSLERTRCIQYIFIHEDTSYCLLDIETLYREYHNQKEPL